MSSQAVAAIRRGRRQAERLMRERCVVRRITGESTDPITGKVTPTAEVVYPLGKQTGRCKVTSYEGYETSQSFADAAITTQRLSVHFPVGSFVMRVGDIVEVTSSQLDELLVGRRYRITQEAPYKSYATAYRVFVDHIAG